MAAAPASGQTYEFWPGTRYDASVPTLEKIAGHRHGERITAPEDIVRYLRALAEARPAQMRVWEYGRTWENRPLIYAVIGSEANLRRLDEIRAGMQALADPRKTKPPEADRLAESLPAPVWLAYGVHGNEISSPDAALLTAYHLLAAVNDPLVNAVLQNALVFLDPLQNPDGRNRFVQHFVQSEGIEPLAEPAAIEHDEPWPGGRTNHYLFDMNRDWFALTQPETQGRVKVLQEWYPQVFVDLHEMGANSTYYFAPEAVPYNPHLERNQRAALDWFGQNNARWFDKFGFSYFTREIFDAFYPGYGASWPSYYGAVAMTYEQASARGLLMRRTLDEAVFHFRDTVRHHFVASIATCETSARRRAELLKNFYRYRSTAIDEGFQGEIKAYVFPARGDLPAVGKLADLLVRQGVEVGRSSAPLTIEGRECPAGSYVVHLAQPAGRLLRTLLDPHVPMPSDFVSEQERRRRKNLPDEIYDVVAWSLPLQYNVEMIAAKTVVAGAFEKIRAGQRPAGSVSGAKEAVAYLVPWGSRAAAKLLAAALRRDLKVRTADKIFELGGREYPRGTLILRAAENPASLRTTLEPLARQTGAEVVAVDTAYVTKGISLGSQHVLPVRKPRVAIAWDRPTAPYSAGAIRFVIERQFGYPVTPIRTSTLRSTRTELDRFDVLILPDAAGGYTGALESAGLERIKEWVRQGGTLIAVGGAMADVADPKVDLLSISREYQPRESGEKAPAKEPEKREPQVPGRLIENEEAFRKAIEPEKKAPDPAPGVLARARLDPDNWVTAGLPETVNVLVQGRNIYTPVKLDKGVNAALFEGPKDLVASGYLWEENRKQLAYKPFVVVQRTGNGVTVGFAADPAFRAYVDGLHVLLMNAIFRSQAEARFGSSSVEE